MNLWTKLTTCGKHSGPLRCQKHRFHWGPHEHRTQTGNLHGETIFATMRW